MNVLFDTNVLLDVIEAREPHVAASAEVRALAEERAFSPFVAAISFNNAYYLISRSLGATKAMESIRLLRSIFRTVPVDDAILDAAMSLPPIDFEDAIQAASTQAISADYLVTRNVRDFHRLGIMTALIRTDFLTIVGP
jgi:predicted nucleic acid-binding protein